MFCAALLTFALAADPKPRLDADGIPLPVEALRRFGSTRFCTDPSKSVAFSSDGKVVYLARSNFGAWTDEKVPAASAWDVATGRKVWELVADDLRGHQVAADPDGKTVWLVGLVGFGNLRKTPFVRLKLDAATGKELTRETVHVGWPQAFDLRPDGLVAWSCYDEKQSELTLPLTKADGSTLARWDPNGHFIERVRFSPNGKILFFAGLTFAEDGWKVAARDVESGKPLWEKACSPIDTLAVSPDGKAVVMTVPGAEPPRAPKAPRVPPATTRVLALSTADGKELGSLDIGGTSHTVFRNNYLHFGRPLSFSLDGKTVLVMTDDRKVLPIDTATWKAGEPRTDGAVYGWYTPDGKAYLNPAGRNLTIHDAKTHRPLAQSPPPLDLPNISFPRLAFTADGKHLTRWGEAWLEWDAATGRETERVPLEKALEGGMVARAGNRFGPTKPVLSPDGKRLLRHVPSTDGKTTGFEVIDTASGKTVAELTDVPSTIRLAFTPDSKRLVAGSAVQGVLTWDLAAGGKPDYAAADRRKGGGSIDAIRVHPNSGQVALWEASDDAVNPTKWHIGRYDLAPLKRVKGWTGEGCLTTFEYTPGGRIVGITERRRLVPDGPGDLFVIDPDADAVAVFPLAIHGVALATSPSACAVGTKSGEIHVYELATGKKRHTFTGLKRPALSLAFSPDGKTLASESADGPVILWDVKGELSKSAKPNAAGWGTAWADLTGDDAEKAFDAMRLIAAHPDDGAVELKKRFTEVKAPTTVSAERAVEALRLAGTESARKQIAEWAKGPDKHPLTVAAKRK